MKIRIMTVGLLLAVAFAGCRKEPMNNLTNEESRIYITNYDSGTIFSNYQTFSIADSVTVIDNDKVSVQFNAVDQAFVNAVKSNMQQRGYTFVPKSQNPDLALNVSRIIRTNTGIISYNNYWDLYDSYYDPFYWGYSGYGYGVPTWGYATYQVKEGLLSVDMGDLKNASSNNQIKLIWNGMIRGSGIFDASTASSQVNQLFTQSPYLMKN